MKFEIEGLDELLKKMENIKQETKYKGGRFALRKAANVVSASVKESAERIDDPKTAHRIYLNPVVRFSSRRFKRTGDLMFRVGILGGASEEKKDESNPGGATWYWRLLEFGTEKMQARPFMRPALEQNIDRATGQFVLHFKKAIDRAIKRGIA